MAFQRDSSHCLVCTKLLLPVWLPVTVWFRTLTAWVELSWVESRYLYAAPNSLFSHNGAGRWFTHAGKAESSAGAWKCSATVRGLVAKEVDCSRLRSRTPRSSAGQWKSELWAREGFQSLQSAIDAFPRLKWPDAWCMIGLGLFHGKAPGMMVNRLNSEILCVCIHQKFKLRQPLRHVRLWMEEWQGRDWNKAAAQYWC